MSRDTTAGPVTKEDFLYAKIRDWWMPAAGRRNHLLGAERDK